MNLWVLFPESMLSIRGIFYLPYPAVIAYLLVALLVFKVPEHRAKLLFFLIFTLVTNIVIFSTLGPGMSGILIPALLFLVIALPLIWLIRRVIIKDKPGITLFAVTSLAGVLHSVSWFVWIIALAGS